MDRKCRGEAEPISRQKTLLLWARAKEEKSAKKSQFKLTKENTPQSEVGTRGPAERLDVAYQQD